MSEQSDIEPGSKEIKTEPFGFRHLARPGWFQDAYHSTMLVRLATTLWLSREELLKKREFPLILPFDLPVAFGVVELAGGKLPVSEWLMFGSVDGMPQVHVSTREVDAPNGVFISIRTPLVVDGYDTGYGAATARLDAAMGLVATYAGRNFIRDTLFQGVMSGETNGWNLHSTVLRMPAREDGPYIEAGLWGLIEECANATDVAAREVRTRILLALEFIGRALGSSEAFLFYWTAFEILSGGAQGTRADLAKAYGLKHAQHIDHATGFGKISDLRHKMIHSGAAVQLSAPLERYIQLLLIDLTRLKLGLDSQFHALVFQNNPAAALDEIGVPNDWKRMFPSD